MMLVIWDLEDDLRGNVRHIAEHGVTPEEVEEVLNDWHARTTYSASSGRPITFGWTAAGRYLAVVWEVAEEDPLTIYPVTAYPAPEPSRED
ncbi:MAG: hypothetical protein WCB27_22985 [Thermoguttaceae bacterium]|jgi:uncharacterized DUF497 family protein